MNIYTLTLNPAYDIHASAQQLALQHENLADIRSRNAGGKGVNISRALCSHKIHNTAIVVLGSENRADFKSDLESAGVESIFLERQGRIRENITLHCADGTETRISFRGFSVDDSILDEVYSLINAEEDTVVTFTGSVPSGISKEGVMRFLRILHAEGVKLVLDSKSLTLQDLYDLKPWLIKPNQEEISAYFDTPIATIQEALEKAQEFVTHGVENVMVSLGAQGAMLLSRGNTYIALPPIVEAVSTIGAGDSSIAGFIAAAIAGKDPAQCLKSAVAFGTAACLTEGSLPPSAADTAEIASQVQITIIET